MMPRGTGTLTLASMFQGDFRSSEDIRGITGPGQRSGKLADNRNMRVRGDQALKRLYVSGKVPVVASIATRCGW